MPNDALDQFVDGRPSVYSQAQRTVEVNGLTLHPQDTLEQLLRLQRRNCERAARGKAMRAQASRGTRLRRLSTITALLWLGALVGVVVYV